MSPYLAAKAGVNSKEDVTMISEPGHNTTVKVFTDAKVTDKPVLFEAIVDISFSEKAQAR